MKTEDEIKDDVIKIIDVFSGVDGGVQFAKFYHMTLPTIIDAYVNGDENARVVIDAFHLVKRTVTFDNFKEEKEKK